jgi:hypothetical protein
VLRVPEPRSFWRHFEMVTTWSRARRRPQERRFELRQDAGRNLVIRVPASLTREAAQTRVLDGHVDLACERDQPFFRRACACAAGTDDDSMT